MPSNTLISGLPYANGPDQPSLPFHTNNLAQKLDPLVIPSFGSAQLRDVTLTPAILAKAPNGGEGLHCYIVGSGMWEYDGALWVPMGPRVVGTYVASAGQSAGAAANGGVTYIQGINGGSPFVLHRKRMVRVTVNAVIRCDTVNSQFRVHVYEAAGEFIDWRDNIAVAAGPGAQWFQATSLPLPFPAGSHSIGCTVSLTSGSGIVGVDGLTVVVTDEGPA